MRYAHARPLVGQYRNDFFCRSIVSILNITQLSWYYPTILKYSCQYCKDLYGISKSKGVDKINTVVLFFDRHSDILPFAKQRENKIRSLSYGISP